MTKGELEILVASFRDNHLQSLVKSYGPGYLDFWSRVSFADMEPVKTCHYVILEKFLTAREGNVSQALDMFVNTLAWRWDYLKNNAVNNDTTSKVLDTVGFIHGQDRLGNPVTYNMYGALDVDSVFNDPNIGVDGFIRWRIDLMEKSLNLLDFNNSADSNKITQVSDLWSSSIMVF